MLQAKSSRYARLAIIALLYSLTASVFYLLFTTEVTTPENYIAMLRLVIVLFMAPIFLKYALQVLSAPCYSMI